MHTNERRGSKRIPLELHGYAVINGVSADLKTRDISQGGALVKLATSTALRRRMKLLVRLNIGFMGRGTVCWVKTCAHCILYGIRFERFDHHSDLLLIAYLIRHERQLSGKTSIQ